MMTKMNIVLLFHDKTNATDVFNRDQPHGSQGND